MGLDRAARRVRDHRRRAQHDRWATLIRASGLTDGQAASAIESDAFGPLAAELRRAEANHHDVGAPPRLVAREDSATPTTSPPSSTTGSSGRPPVQQDQGGAGSRRASSRDSFHTPTAWWTPRCERLDERETLIEARADAMLDTALAETAPWTKALGTAPDDRRRPAAWRKAARVVAAYRDRYRITDDAPLGAPAESAARDRRSPGACRRGTRAVSGPGESPARERNRCREDCLSEWSELGPEIIQPARARWVFRCACVGP